MLERCYNPNKQHYHNYGGRGITVCDEWKNSFENFYKDMGEKPKGRYSLERIDNELGYSKINCKWATDLEQANNRRSNHNIEYNGKTLNLTEWSIILNIPQECLSFRINKKIGV